MIQYALKCDQGHAFDSWFRSADAFEALQTEGHVVCASCGSPNVSKAVMAPRVSKAQAAPTAPIAPADAPDASEDISQKLKALQKHVEKTADYVGNRFAKEARSMYLGDTEARPIYGEANREEAKSLIEDGVPVAPLPFLPSRKVN